MQDLKIFKNLFNVEDKVALVTGGGTGIGKIISEVLALAGSKVYITSRKLEIIKKTAEEINLKKPKHQINFFLGKILTFQSKKTALFIIKTIWGKLYFQSQIYWGITRFII